MQRQICPISMERHPVHEGSQAQKEMFSFLVVNDLDSGRNSNSDLMEVSYARETLGQAAERFFFFVSRMFMGVFFLDSHIQQD